MPRTKQYIMGQVAGDRFGVNRAVTGIPAVLTIIKAWLTIKTSADVLDASASLQKIITASFVANVGQITGTGTDINGGPAVEGGDRVGAIAFIVTEAESLALGYLRTYVYDIQLKFSDNSIATLEWGDLQLIRGVTDAAS